MEWSSEVSSRIFLERQDSLLLAVGPTLWPMSCTEFLRARVSPELKLQVKTIADRELLSEAAWLKRLVIREIRAAHGADAGEREPCRADGARRAEQ